jgi:hypothetical protein
MYEGFSDYECFIDSIGDGFTNALNERLSKKAELLCNSDGCDILLRVFTEPLSSQSLRNVTKDQLQALKQRIAGRGLKLNDAEVLNTLRQALTQSTGTGQLDCDRK